MPVCIRCETMSASADLRRSPVPDRWLCKDKRACKERRHLLLWLRRIGDARLLAELNKARAHKDSIYTYTRSLEREAERRGLDGEESSDADTRDRARPAPARKQAAKAGRGRR